MLVLWVLLLLVLKMCMQMLSVLLMVGSSACRRCECICSICCRLLMQVCADSVCVVEVCCCCNPKLCHFEGLYSIYAARLSELTRPAGTSYWPAATSCWPTTTSCGPAGTVVLAAGLLVLRAGQTQMISRFRVFAHPTRRHFGDAMGEDAGNDANAKDAMCHRREISRIIKSKVLAK